MNGTTLNESIPRIKKNKDLHFCYEFCESIDPIEWGANHLLNKVN